MRTMDTTEVCVRIRNRDDPHCFPFCIKKTADHVFKKFKYQYNDNISVPRLQMSS